jgi:nucleoid-associated protein YgaU
LRTNAAPATPTTPRIAPQANTAPIHPPRLINPVPSPAPAPEAAPAAPSHSAAAVTGDHYTVVSGDCLSTIAARVTHSSWATLYEVNKNVVGGNPDLILPGQVLTIPS